MFSEIGISVLWYYKRHCDDTSCPAVALTVHCVEHLQVFCILYDWRGTLYYCFAGRSVPVLLWGSYNHIAVE